jgi:Flp pilus assembly protein TadG
MMPILPWGVAMYVRQATEKCVNLLRRFRREQRGHVVITFTLLLVPLVGCAGAALDYSRANSVKAALQAALDATALMLAKNAGVQTTDQITALGTGYFKAEFKRKEAHNPRIKVDYTVGSSTIVLNASASVDTTLLRIMGFNRLRVTASSTAKWGASSQLRVALVLDNTGSMADAGKMSALKTASKNLLAKLQSAATSNGSVYVSIIPFSKDVNVGAGNYSQPWVRWDFWDAANGSSLGGVWTPANHNTWNGCVTDRDQSYDTTNTAAAVGTPATLFPAEQYNYCPVAVLPMTYDWAALRFKVDSMTPTGNTNQGIGLAWGWLSLTAGSILNPPAKSSSYTYEEHIILLTDGLNTQNRWYIDQASIDAREKILCDNVKAAGITLWTIQVNTGGDATSTLLQQCATDSSKFFLLTASDQIISTFDNISFKITKLHLSK